MARARPCDLARLQDRQAERARRERWGVLVGLDAEPVRLAARNQLGSGKRFFRRHVVQVADLVVGAERRRKAGLLPLRLRGTRQQGKHTDDDPHERV